MRKGWFEIPGVQTGDRTADEQLRGLDLGILSCKGATVLDLGCAEALIAASFARAGAARVLGIELLADHVAAARKVCKGLPVEVVQAELNHYIDNHPDHERFDIVLALGIAHKLLDPGKVIDFAARCAKELVIFRGPGREGMYWDGVLKSKFGDGSCHVPTIFQKHGFAEDVTLPSAHGERAQYWRRAA